MKKIVIIGSGGYAKEVAFLIEEINRFSKEWEIVGYVDNNNLNYCNGKYRVVYDDKELENYNSEIYVAFGIGNPEMIKKLSMRFIKSTYIKFPNLIHPNAVGDWERINFGIGNIVGPGNIFSTDISIGSFNSFNIDCTTGHDTIIGNYNVINPSVNISGGVNVSNICLLGTGSQILQYIKFNSDKIVIGAGSVVTKNIDEEGIYVGIPAKKLIKNN